MHPGRRYVVISPCRDEAKYMRQTLDSVIAQSIRPARWIIVDDGSTDETPQILAEYRARLARANEQWGTTKQNDLAALNHTLAAGGVKEIHVPTADEIRIGEPPESKDLP